MAVIRTDPRRCRRRRRGHRAPAAPGPRRRRRIGGGIAVLIPIVLLSSFITYSLGALSNSDPAATILGQDAATPAAVAHLNNVLGLDKPLVVQYWDWLSQAVHGNLGRSYFTQIPVSQSIAQRLPVDLSIAITAVILAVIIGGTAGTVAAIRRGGWFDRGVTVGLLGGLDAAGVRRRDHPGGHLRGGGAPLPGQRLRRAAPRASAAGLSTSSCRAWRSALQVAADIARQLRTSLVAVLEQNYITGARVRGLPYRRILLRHALRNAAGPALVILGYDFPHMLAGAVAAEAVFSLPGLGQLLLDERADQGHPGGAGRAAGGRHVRRGGQPRGQHAAQLALPDRATAVGT